MKQTLAAVGVLAFLVTVNVPLEAQTVDFSGIWSLDREASELPEFRGGGGFGRGMATTVEITQNEERFVIMEQRADDGSWTITYLLDGSESTNDAGRAPLTSMSSWDGATLVTEGSRSISTPRGDFTIDVVEQRSLSDNGQTMTIRSLLTTSRGDRTTTLVYRREN
jgi:hypothetical protein